MSTVSSVPLSSGACVNRSSITRVHSIHFVPRDCWRQMSFRYLSFPCALLKAVLGSHTEHSASVPTNMPLGHTEPLLLLQKTCKLTKPDAGKLNEVVILKDESKLRCSALKDLKSQVKQVWTLSIQLLMFAHEFNHSHTDSTCEMHRNTHRAASSA